MLLRLIFGVTLFRLIMSIIRAVVAFTVPGAGPAAMMSLARTKNYSEAKAGRMLASTPRLGIGTAILGLIYAPGFGAKVLCVLWGAAVYAGNTLALKSYL